jgi:hypothetical protein
MVRRAPTLQDLMKDAVLASPKLVTTIAAFTTGVTIAASVALAIASHETLVCRPTPLPAAPARELPPAPEQRALALATAKYGDPGHPFEVFSTLTQGDRRGVFVRRSTGGCGGCGALAVAVIFRGEQVELVDQLGEYGRFGNGPDAIRFREVVGRLVIEVDESMTLQGYTSTHREFFVVEHDRLAWQLCLQTAGSDAGARDRASEFMSKVWIAAEGTLYFVPDYTRRGDDAPQLRAFSMPFQNGGWVRPVNEGRCIDPRS